MSTERILIIKQFRDTDVAACISGLESSPERYSVLIANNYQEGRNMLREHTVTETENLSLVIIDAEEVDSYTLELLTSIRGANNYLPVIVMTRLASNSTRQQLTSMSSECIIKVGSYDKFLWNVVKSSLERNTKQPRRTGIKSNKSYRAFTVGKKRP